MALINKLKAIGDAIRAKTGGTETLTLDQMVIEINGFSAGAALNFEVVGGEYQPVEPSENTIWIDTNVAFTEYVFSATEPEGKDGIVWIMAGTSSDVQFSVSEDNIVYIYPIGAKQYIDGKFVSKNAWAYIGEKWVKFSADWDGHYFKDGNLFEEITGGWTTSGSVTIGTTMDFYSPAGYESEYATASTVNMIDLTNVSTLYCEHTHDGGQYKQHLCVGKEVKSYTSTDVKVDMGGGIAALNVSDLDGEYYIYINGRGGNQGSLSVSVSAIWGE